MVRDSRCSGKSRLFSFCDPADSAPCGTTHGDRSTGMKLKRVGGVAVYPKMQLPRLGR